MAEGRPSVVERMFMSLQAVRSGDYYVFTTSRCPDICPVVPCQHRVGRGSGPFVGRVGSQNSPSWVVGRVGSGPILKISNKCAIYMQEIHRL